MSVEMAKDSENNSKPKDISSQGLVWRNNDLDMILLPWCLQDPKGSILRILNNKIGKYDKEMNGIIISYKNVKVLQNLGTIRNDSAEIHINVKVTFLVFQPTVGSKLYGVINKKCVTHLSVLIHRIFNVVIPRPNDDMNIKWIGDTLDVGQKVPFSIKVLDLFGALPYISGELNEELLKTNEFEDDSYVYDEQSKFNIASVNFDETKPKTVQSDTDECNMRKKRKREVSDNEEPDKKLIKLSKNAKKSTFDDEGSSKKSKQKHLDSNGVNEELNEKKLAVDDEGTLKKSKRKQLDNNGVDEELNQNKNMKKSTVDDERSLKKSKRNHLDNNGVDEVLNQNKSASKKNKFKKSKDENDSNTSTNVKVSKQKHKKNKLNTTKTDREESSTVDNNKKAILKNSKKTNSTPLEETSSSSDSSDEDMNAIKLSILNKIRSSMLSNLSSDSDSSDEDRNESKVDEIKSNKSKSKLKTNKKKR